MENENELKSEVKRLIDKWEGEYDLWQSVIATENALFYTKEQKIKGAHYSMVIASVLSDLKEIYHE